MNKEIDKNRFNLNCLPIDQGRPNSMGRGGVQYLSLTSFGWSQL